MRLGALGFQTNHMDAQPSASWKLNAMSTLLSVHTIRVSAEPVRHETGGRDDCRDTRALLFLEAIVLDNLSLKEPPVGLVFGIDNYAGLFGLAFFNLNITRTNQSARGWPKGVIRERGRFLADAGKTWRGAITARWGKRAAWVRGNIPARNTRSRSRCRGRTSHLGGAHRP